MQLSKLRENYPSNGDVRDEQILGLFPNVKDTVEKTQLQCNPLRPALDAKMEWLKSVWFFLLFICLMVSDL